MQRGYDIVQLDESIFNCLKVDRVHWAPVGDPHVVARKFESRQTIALCGAISAREGLVYIASRPRSFDRAALIDVFEGIAKYFKDKDKQLKVAIFLDNCRIHKHEETLAAAERLQIPLVFCPRYRPDCNGIELLWRKAKHLFRLQTDNYRANNVQGWNITETALDICKSIPDEEARHYAEVGWRNLERAEAIKKEDWEKRP
jgi:transposase